VTDEDIILAAELALPHRIRGRVFQDTVLSAEELSERLDEVQGEMGVGDMGDREEEAEEAAATGKKKPEARMMRPLTGPKFLSRRPVPSLFPRRRTTPTGGKAAKRSAVHPNLPRDASIPS
jgi:Mg-chelatase subunit ChlI